MNFVHERVHTFPFIIVKSIMFKFSHLLPWSIIAIINLTLVLAHLRLRQPPNRSSIWRDSQFDSFNPPKNYDDDGVYCGRVLQQLTVTQCGICGDNVTDPRPRDNEDGGKYGRGIIVGGYSPGEVISIKVEFTTTHQGYIEMQFCDRAPETEDCFQSLKFGDGSTKIRDNQPEGQKTWINTTLQLPANVHCHRCVLRIQYRAGNRWGDCGNGTSGMACGLQETFRQCADISIH